MLGKIVINRQFAIFASLQGLLRSYRLAKGAPSDCGGAAEADAPWAHERFHRLDAWASRPPPRTKVRRLSKLRQLNIPDGAPERRTNHPIKKSPKYLTPAIMYSIINPIP